MWRHMIVWQWTMKWRGVERSVNDINYGAIPEILCRNWGLLQKDVSLIDRYWKEANSQQESAVLPSEQTSLVTTRNTEQLAHYKYLLDLQLLDIHFSYVWISRTSFQDNCTVPFLEGQLHSSHFATLIRFTQGNWSHYARVLFHQWVQPGVDLKESFVCSS